MYNTQFYVYRLVRDVSAKETKHEEDYISIVDAYVEPAGLSAVAPIEASIGQPFTVFIESIPDLDLRDGYKLVNVADAEEYYFITSVIEGFKNEANNYQLSVYKPKPEQITI